jgi:hypothetical protein
VTADLPEPAGDEPTQLPGGSPLPHDGTGRVELSFTVLAKEGTATTRSVRVPPGVTVFGAAAGRGRPRRAPRGGPRPPARPRRAAPPRRGGAGAPPPAPPRLVGG